MQSRVDVPSFGFASSGGASSSSSPNRFVADRHPGQPLSAEEAQREASRVLAWTEQQRSLPAAPWPNAMPGSPDCRVCGWGTEAGPVSPGTLADGISEEDWDPWAAILRNGGKEFCAVPAATLDRLRAVGEAQLAEIEQLRIELANAPEVQVEAESIEAKVRELEIACTVAENELELRRQEAAELQDEAARLRPMYEAKEREAQEARERVAKLESWLAPVAPHDVVGPSQLSQPVAPVVYRAGLR